MLYYVTMARHLSVGYARSVTHSLQVVDTENTYICPNLALQHVSESDVGRDWLKELRFDLLCACDAVLIVSSMDDMVADEVELAKKLQMEVRYLGDNQPI